MLIHFHDFSPWIQNWFAVQKCESWHIVLCFNFVCTCVHHQFGPISVCMFRINSRRDHQFLFNWNLKTYAIKYIAKSFGLAIAINFVVSLLTVNIHQRKIPLLLSGYSWKCDGQRLSQLHGWWPSAKPRKIETSQWTKWEYHLAKLVSENVWFWVCVRAWFSADGVGRMLQQFIISQKRTHIIICRELWPLLCDGCWLLLLLHTYN